MTDREDRHDNAQQQQNQVPQCSSRIEPIESSLQLTANDYKNTGNKLCALNRYDEAIVYYGKAIGKNPDVPAYYYNRALCHLKLQHWQAAIIDCRRALEIDSNIIKAHFFLGQALAETGNFDDALNHLQIAQELAKEKKLNFGDDIAYQIRLTKRRRWNKIEESEAQLENELQEYLMRLIRQDKENKIRDTRANSPNNSSTQDAEPDNDHSQQQTTSGTEPFHIRSLGSSSEDSDHQTCREADAVSKCDSYMNKLESMFTNLRLQRKKREVPDYLCGKISFEIMRDPVITPSGITYDREDIEEHIRRVGHFDPITRQPLTADQLISNLAMKEVVDAYLNENEWARYY